MVLTAASTCTADVGAPSGTSVSWLTVPADRRLASPAIDGRAEITFAELAEEWLELRMSSGRRPLRARTASEYRKALDLVLLPRFGRQPVRGIDAERIAGLIRDLEGEGLHAIDASRARRPLLEPTITNYLKPLQGVLRLAVRRRIIADNPFAHLTDDDRPAVRKKKQAHVWSDEQLSALLAASQRLAQKPTSYYDYTPLLRLTARLGLRLGEVLGLQWTDFDRAGGVLHVRRQWLRTTQYGPTKTDSGTRTIPLPHDLQNELVELRVASRYSRDDDPIFASRRGTPLGHRNVAQRGFERAAREAGIRGVCFHDLRHAAASRLIAKGVDPVTVAAILGHGDPNVTLRVYSHVFDRDERDEAVRRALTAGTTSRDAFEGIGPS
ncbi:MAG TPA: site-specific integrase [Gaiellaceae bacterium]|nr:site-specific integrase [Gaiellaceae bacterium]